MPFSQRTRHLMDYPRGLANGGRPRIEERDPGPQRVARRSGDVWEGARRDAGVSRGGPLQSARAHGLPCALASLPHTEGVPAALEPEHNSTKEREQALDALTFPRTLVPAER